MQSLSSCAPLDVLRSIFGYDTFRPNQEEIITRVVRGEDTLVLMPTGGGKSLCYQIPAIVRPGTGLVVSPLISLMQDQVNTLKQLGVRAEYLNSSLTRSEQAEIERAFRSGTLDLLYVAPERLVTPGFMGMLSQVELSLLAIDEAHCISQWGHDFRPEYLELEQVRQQLGHVPCIAVTATADEPTRREILRRLHIDPEGMFVTGFDRPNIQYRVVHKQKPLQQLLDFIETDHPNDAGIVYCISRKKVEEVTQWLREHGRDVVPYHAGLSAKDRQRNQDRFLYEEGIIVVATVAFGMGIDKPNVRFVAHLDMPKNPESYYQETGRAGRDGLPAHAWLAYHLGDVVTHRRMVESSFTSDQQKWVERHKLDALVGYCETAECRRKVLLSYFGEKLEEPCGNCDTCLNPVETWDGTVAAQKLLSCVYRTGQRFGASHVLDVLTGKDTEKVRRFGHDRLSTFGVGSELSAQEWRSVVRQLVAADFLEVDMDGYGALKLTEACRPVLKGEQKVMLRRDPRPARKKKERVPTSTILPETKQEQLLFEELRRVRAELAREQGVPPYVIFHDSTLVAMAKHRPRSLESFSRLPGVGTAKLERYGETFLEAIQLHEN